MIDAVNTLPIPTTRELIYLDYWEEIDGIQYRMTSQECPEQYNAYKSGKQVAYLRVRHGGFRVKCPNAGGEEVFYSCDIRGDAAFCDGERRWYLTKAAYFINRWLYAQYGSKSIDAQTSLTNYNSHEWVTETQFTPAEPVERIVTCFNCGTENLGDPAEFPELKYPHCDDIGD